MAAHRPAEGQRLVFLLGARRRRPRPLRQPVRGPGQHHLKAYETGAAGAFTRAVLRLLQANPRGDYSNRQVLAYARTHLNIPEAMQQPVFYGPPGALDAPFPLLALRRPTSAPAAAPDTPTAQRTAALSIDIRTQAPLCRRIAEAVAQRDDLRADSTRPDLILSCGDAEVSLYHPVGSRLRTLPPRLEPVLAALSHQSLVHQLSPLDNPAAPFHLRLWLHPPGERRLRQGDKVTLYYRADDLPVPRAAYPTLLNLAPDGGLSILYPRPARAGGSQASRRYLSAEIRAGVVHSILKGRATLRPGEHAAVDLRIRLDQPGREVFKAIVTARPLHWESPEADPWRGPLRDAEARALLRRIAEGLEREPFWSSGELRVRVDPPGDVTDPRPGG
jgi:hypothetical protein